MPKPLIVDEVDAMGHLQTQTPGSDLWSRSAKLTKSVRIGTLPPVPEHALFQEHNITGTTGARGPEPSVYYQSGDTFSHITTNHSHADNIGRSKVRTHADYHVGNTGPNGASQEFYNGRVRHTSRHPFTQVHSTQEQQRLHTAANAFPNLKPKYQ